jgi:hypothetical protein
MLPGNGLEAYLIGVVVLVFNAGGVFYLAKNHFAHINVKLDSISDRFDLRLRSVEQRLARLEGALRFPRDLTEN